MTQTYNDNVVINDTLEVNGTSDTVQVAVKGAANQSDALQQWQDHSGNVFAEIDADGHLLIGDQDDTPEALIEAHNLDDVYKPSRGLHLRGILSGTLSHLISWVVQELALKGTGGLSALHRVLRVHATNENTGPMEVGAEIRAGDFEVTNVGGNPDTNNLEMSAVVAKVNNDSSAHLQTAYGVKVDMSVPEGSASDVYSVYTEGGTVYIGDSEIYAPLNLSPRSTAPSAPRDNDIYLDISSDPNQPRLRQYSQTEDVWLDISGTGSTFDPEVDGYWSNYGGYFVFSDGDYVSQS